MAKKTDLNPGLLFAISAALLCAGWIVKPFPACIMAGIAPLFAIMDHIKDEGRFWNLSELILASLAVAFFAAHRFDLSLVVITLFQAIVMTGAFLAGTVVHRNLGAGKWTVIIFWMTLEYLMGYVPWHHDLVFLSDSISPATGWLGWNSGAGPYRVSLWILLVNYLLYLGILKSSGINWLFLGAAILLITAPIVYSLLQLGGLLGMSDGPEVHGPWVPDGNFPESLSLNSRMWQRFGFFR